LNRWFRRLACRTAGHDWSNWRFERTFKKDGKLHAVHSRYCKRLCSLPGSYGTRALPVWEEDRIGV
jgi:hypothetical protein